MGKALPNWLTVKYFTLLSCFSLIPFNTDEAKKALCSEKAALFLHKMHSYGWVERVDRGVYRVVHPVIALMESSGFSWRERVKNKDRLPILEFAVARFFEVLGSRLESIVLFGSLASGRVRPESDIDLLIVARDLPRKYSERTSIIREAVSSRLMDELIIRTWREKGVYTDFDILLMDIKEAGVTHPFYLDLTRDCIIIYDKNELMSRKIAEVREKLEKIGARRFEEPDGSWYWILSPEAEMVKSVEL
ncbi:MAG: nucleotidyltransferase domain-containing protein [Candidatus Brockarchaeota archaeon]|nr:nucleotidyltransferase domain-containing protein [Candidatus Brockarchaeota archaeon]